MLGMQIPMSVEDKAGSFPFFEQGGVLVDEIFDIRLYQGVSRLGQGLADTGGGLLQVFLPVGYCQIDMRAPSGARWAPSLAISAGRVESPAESMKSSMRFSGSRFMCTA